MTVKCKYPLGDLIWKIKVSILFYSILFITAAIKEKMYFILYLIRFT